MVSGREPNKDKREPDSTAHEVRVDLKAPELQRAWEKHRDLSALLDRDVAPAVTVSVGNLQREKAEQLEDLTYAKALEALLKHLRHELREAEQLFPELARKKFSKFDETDREKAAMKGIIISDLQRLLLRAEAEQRDWGKESWEAVSSNVQEAYRREVSGYWKDELAKEMDTNPYRREEAEEAKTRLDTDHNLVELVVELRTALGIPDEGFQDIDRAARWLHHRWPGGTISRPDQMNQTHYARGPGDVIGIPNIWYVPVLAVAARQLRKELERAREKGQSKPEWDLVLCFYLLHCILEPLPVRRPLRPPLEEELHRQIFELTEKYKPLYKALFSYICGLTDEDWEEIAAKHPAANKKRWISDQRQAIEDEAEKIARRKGTYDPKREWLTYAYLRQIRHRMRRKM